jgi:Tol biopolymer transport system component
MRRARRIIPRRFGALATLVAAAALAAGLLALVQTMVQPKLAEAAFPGKNGEIAFQSSRDGNEEIYVMRADGTNQTRLTTDPRRDVHPAFSSDGKRLTFTIRRPEASGDEIYVMNADGTNQTGLTHHTTSSFQSVFSPDGTKIAFVSSRDGNPEIYTMNSDGTDQSRLTNTTANEVRPAFSPDGKKIAFGRRDPSNPDPSKRRDDIYLINLEDGVETRLTTNPAQDNEANFSPDGKKIAFNRSGDIYLMNLDDRVETRLTNTSGIEEFPAFSPDGEQIAFASNHDGNLEIYVMASDGTGTRMQLTRTDSPVVNTKPDWGADTTAPTFSNVPAPLTQEASGPSGAEITYDEPTATDRVDGSVAVECSPASGSTFPLGTTEVTCTARDKAGNKASESFTVTVKGAGEQLSDLVASVRSLDIHDGIENSLLSKLRSAQDQLEANDQEGACEDLRAFTNHARAQSDKKLTQEQASQLIEDADRIRAVLGC